MKPGDLAQVIRETLESYKYHLEKKQFVVRSEIPPEFPPVVFDRESMVSMLVNLLSNAMKFSVQKKEVDVRLEATKTHAVLKVTDKGVGIAPGEQTRIFERFYRSQRQTAGGTSGSGLGLPLVKYTVEAHGGFIRVNSKPGEGSTFSIHIPFAGLKGTNR